ncbi:MAG: phosphoribosylformylglycinamidine synthase subunit PurS [Bacteroidetes bacterium]|jgi:phosphoribosylformylglycinamidine synthase subunit PurS|nr:MAG: phosphoribosylformylglycinamidine synthase subunit PurS [Bacteroidota bacterium]TAE64838.1 MAG: phosphoribosylformylglycinamidine synthase subunit PurS [Bacteroidota bacterium]TAF96166.1 MAG: phosphoribosylformylglycinamidine synthase subunit PurS [Bacteroidota bacterium]
MTYNIGIQVMPLSNLLDPQGKAVENGLQNLQLSTISNVRVGKYITVQVEAASEAEALATAETAAKKLLANQVMEQFHIAVI